MAWDNLLLSCKYCNTRKGTHVRKGDKDKYLWPDEDDTFHAYLYDKNIPRLNEKYLLAQASGFFSVWMDVFKDDEEAKKMLISAFKGTKAEYCLD